MPKTSNKKECVTQEISQKVADKNNAVHVRGITDGGNFVDEKMIGGSIMEPKVNGRNVETSMSATASSIDGYTSSENELVCFI